MTENKSFETALHRNKAIWDRIYKDPSSICVLTGERPTGALHIGHYFGTLQSRLKLQELGVRMFIIIADYQVLTDRETSTHIKDNVKEVILDYLAIGLDPKKVTIFCHSYLPELNQLLLPFMSLVSVAELDRNPTVKSEIALLRGINVSALMYTYPLHQAADILFCHGNMVPGGRDQLPHIELARLITKRFNQRYAGGKEYFQAPEVLLSDAPLLLGVDGQKMGKSMGNAIFLKMSEDETAKLLQSAKTDNDRQITYDPLQRPEVSNLILLTSLCSGYTPDEITKRIGDKGSGALKKLTIEAVNEYFVSIRKRRLELKHDLGFIRDVLRDGNEHARTKAQETLKTVQQMMEMEYY